MKNNTPVDVTLSIKAKEVHEAMVTAAGTGGKIGFPKKYIGRKVLVIPLEE